MVGLGGMEMILLLGMMGGGDLQLAQVIPAADYFKSRQIEPTPDKLIELAGQTPDSAKKQLQQLLALRQLSADFDGLKKSAKAAEYRRLLAEIAQGKKAADATGFAAEFAKKALAAWDGTKSNPQPVRSWKEGLRGLPENATLVGVMEMAASRTGEGRIFDFGPMFAMMPNEVKEQMFAGIEKIGNFRVDRVAYGVVEPAGEGNVELIVRVSGRANPEWIAQLFPPSYKTQTRDGPGGPIRILTSSDPGPAIALIGNGDLVIAGSLPRGKDKEDPAKHLPVLERFLASLAKASPGPVHGVLKDDLARVPTTAASVTLGQLPREMRSEHAPFPMPEKIVIHTQAVAGGLDLQFQGQFGDEVKAKGLLQTIGQGRDMALKELAKLQGQPLPVPGLNLGSVVNMLESVQLQTNGAALELRMLMPEDALLAVPMWGMMAFRVMPKGN